MVAPRKSTKVYCTVIRVPVDHEAINNRLERPSDLLPWADPYIARLVQNLQHEIRTERQLPADDWRNRSGVRAELEPPCPLTEPDWDWNDEPRWSLSDEPARE